MAFAKNMDLASRFSNMSSGLFAQVGGSYNSVNLNQNIDGTAISQVYDPAGTLVANGDAGGPDNPFIVTQSTFAPQLQLGYARKVGRDEDWYFGVKLSYKFLGMNFSDNNINSFQVGTFTTDSGEDAFTGHFVISSCQTNINSEMNLMAFAGYSIRKNYNIYLGISPVLFNSSLNIYNATGYANINGVHSDITGNPASFFNDQWMWGTAGEIGVNYNLNDRWSLQCSYNYAITGTYVIDNSATFIGSTTSDSVIYTTTGTAIIATTQRVIAQAIGFAVNFVF